MAGMVVTTTEVIHTSVKKITFAWTSDDTLGTATGATTAVLDGKLIHLVTIPDGVAVPTDLYDVTVTDSDSVDVLIGAGANRSSTLTQAVAEASLGAVAGSTLTVNVSNAGNAKQGQVILYIR